MLKECPKINVLCKIEGCGQVFLREQLKFHLLNECSNAKIECDVCEIITKSSDDNHSCTLYLKNKVKELEKMNQNLKQINWETIV